MPRPPPRPPLFPYTTLFRSDLVCGRRMGARLSARASLQVIRIVLRAPAVSGGALSHRARAIRPAHHEARSEEHTSELQSRRDLVCRLLLEKKNTKSYRAPRE